MNIKIKIEEYNDIAKSLELLGLKLDIDKRDCIAWIKADTSVNSNFACLITKVFDNLQLKEKPVLHVFEKGDMNCCCCDIDLNKIETIYEL